MARKSLDGKDVWSALLVLFQRPRKNSGLPWDGKLHGPSLIFCILNMIDIHQYVRQGQQQALGGYWIGFGVRACMLAFVSRADAHATHKCAAPSQMLSGTDNRAR